MVPGRSEYLQKKENRAKKTGITIAPNTYYRKREKKRRGKSHEKT
jgi:hypothetical protein